MARILCSMNCKNRSKRAMRGYRTQSGEKIYGCKLPFVSIGRINDPDNYVVEVVGEDNMAQCNHYEPEEDDNESD